jgi:hypothetical protein
MKKIIILLAVMALLMSTGCLRRNLIKVEDNQARPLTMVETIDNYWFFMPGYVIGSHYRFWTCTDQGDSLDCKVECDGETDLDCVGFGWGK